MSSKLKRAVQTVEPDPVLVTMARAAFRALSLDGSILRNSLVRAGGCIFDTSDVSAGSAQICAHMATAQARASVQLSQQQLSDVPRCEP